jgi:sec-independent protein translocase protein TatA
VLEPTGGFALFNQIGPLEIGLVIVVLLLIFGPKRLPRLGKQLGTEMREFKDSITGKDKQDEDREQPALTQAQASAPAATTPSSQPADAPEQRG